MLSRSIGALMSLSLVVACDLVVVDPQTEVVVSAGPATTARMTWLRVTLINNEGEMVERRVDPLGSVVELPATIPVTARDGDAQRRFELVAEAFDTSAEPSDTDVPFNAVRVMAGFTPNAVQRIRVELSDGCVGAPDCGEGRTCWQGQCRGACFESSADASSTATLTSPSCTECQRCGASGVCSDLSAGSPCGCPGDSCQGASCETAAQISEAAGGGSHHCALTGTRDLYCWGANDFGQLGLGGGTSAVRPQLVTQRVRAVACGGSDDPFSCSIAEATSETRCWGSNEDGQLGIGLATSGRDAPTPIDSALSFDSLSLGASHTCAIEPGAAEIWCWGSGSHLKLGNGSPSEELSPVRTSGSERWAAVCAGAQHTCGLNADGQVLCWGFNQDFQLGSDGELDRAAPTLVPLEAGARWSAIACGHFHTCALHEDGRVACWGGNQRGNLGRCRVDRGDNSGSPDFIESSLRFRAVQCGGSQCCAIEAEDARLFCWGDNEAGQVGVGTMLARVCEPVEVAPGVAFVGLGMGFDHSCAIDTDGGLWCWGANQGGQLGVGDTVPRLVPSRVCF